MVTLMRSKSAYLGSLGLRLLGALQFLQGTLIVLLVSLGFLGYSFFHLFDGFWIGRELSIHGSW